MRALFAYVQYFAEYILSAVVELSHDKIFRTTFSKLD